MKFPDIGASLLTYLQKNINKAGDTRALGEQDNQVLCVLSAETAVQSEKPLLISVWRDMQHELGL